MSSQYSTERNGVNQFTLRLDRLSKLAGITALFSLVGSSSARIHPTQYPGTVLSCVDGNCNNCTTGNDNTPGLPANTWPIDAGYPNCDIYPSAVFNGTGASQGPGCMHLTENFQRLSLILCRQCLLEYGSTRPWMHDPGDVPSHPGFQRPQLWQCCT